MRKSITLEFLALFKIRTVFSYHKKRSFRSDDRSNMIVTQSSKIAQSRYLGETCKSRKAYSELVSEYSTALQKFV